ncbi:MAG: class I SAM-dependent methyltransferase [Bacteroidota bacterium]|nr:class I SAM-dependent methyltransferase [Bacteroidota bacterium]|tara:strand:+ start:531 stop:1316 length:786 start_codon:yes stop_codon:yes gene_type:complete
MKKIKTVIKYLQHQIKAKNQHSAHSPFLYNFITQVINQNNKNKHFKSIEKLRKDLKLSNEFINITDYGAGSSVNNAKRRKISDIAKYSAKNKKFGELIYRISQYFNANVIIELGTSLGISTLYLALANSQSIVYTLEGCPETLKIAERSFKTKDVKNIITIEGDFKNTLKPCLQKIKNVDLIFIDGNHQKEPTISYFETFLQYSNNDTVFIFDDIYWSSGMEKAWKYIITHKKTTLTIDLFHLGIVFIKKELSKENYKIKF